MCARAAAHRPEQSQGEPRPRDPGPRAQYTLPVKLRDLAWVLCATSAVTASAALAEGKSNAWSQVKTPADGAARSIGQYTSGCLAGAAELPLDGAGYQVMHPARVRHFGHPDLVSFISDLGNGLRAAELADLMVGDLSQPRGGPAPGGHSSHQTGLDVDLWFWVPEVARKRALTREERETTKARSVLDPKAKTIAKAWSARVLTMLHKAADDGRVERIFVHPIIKRDACNAETGDRTWLRKLRPWYGHDDHFHVRLECPKGAADCVAQTPTPRGDGCKELDWWFSPEATEDRKKGRATYQAKVGKAPGMPAECKELLASKKAVPPTEDNNARSAANKRNASQAAHDQNAESAGL